MYTSIILLSICSYTVANPTNFVAADLDDDDLHPSPIRAARTRQQTDIRENNSSFWKKNAQETLGKLKKITHNENVAKNVILFLGDGMSIPTLAGARVYIGGEEKELAFEKFEHSALSKTYCVDAQTADSACTATAYLCGVKNNIGMIGVTAAVEKDNCDAMVLEENQVESIAKWSQDVGKRTGIVTTSTVTDASPAGAYAKIANRAWQTDTAITKSGRNATKCRDISYQLVKWAPGKLFNVILGGGSRVFLPNGTQDALGSQGQRSDGLNLITEWLKDRHEEGNAAEYVWNRTGLLNISKETDYVLGLFSESSVPYNLDRNISLTPSLEEMTEVAIDIVSKGSGAENGYFLFIEGGRIDHGHHANRAKKAFDETAEFSKAIEKALAMTSESDTLIVVTSDHAHTMSISGYPDRNSSIFGVAGKDSYDVARLTINYANGPGFVESGHDYANDDTENKNYRFPAVTKLNSETHGGDDVAVFARGPWAHLYSGVLEQHIIPHIMAYASCVGESTTVCSERSGASRRVNILSYFVVTGVFFSFYFS